MTRNVSEEWMVFIFVINSNPLGTTGVGVARMVNVVTTSLHNLHAFHVIIYPDDIMIWVRNSPLSMCPFGWLTGPTFVPRGITLIVWPAIIFFFCVNWWSWKWFYLGAKNPSSFSLHKSPLKGEKKSTVSHYYSKLFCSIPSKTGGQQGTYEKNGRGKERASYVKAWTNVTTMAITIKIETKKSMKCSTTGETSITQSVEWKNQIFPSIKKFRRPLRIM